jgi:N4-gp56 family major capsid protein
MAFTLNMSTTSSVDNSIILAYDQQFIVAAAQEQIMDQFASYKASINAKSIEFPKYAQLALATTPLDEDDDVTSEAMSDSQIILTPAEYGNVVTRTALASLQTGGKADLAAARLVGMNMGRTMDKLALLALDASSNSLTVDGGAESALDANDIMTTTFLNTLYNKLARSNVQPLSDGMYVFVAHDDVIHDLRNSAGAGSWVDINKYARPESVLMNEVGMLCGFKIVRDNHSTITADAGALLVDTYRSYALGFNAFGKAVSQESQMVISGPYDKLSRFLNIGWKGCFQYKIVDQDALWMGITASSVGANLV